MDLIKNLAEYSIVKAELSKPIKLLNGVDYKKMEDAILEYRRAHNIFEVGDIIIFVDDFMHGELMTVAWTRKGEVWMDDGAKRCTDLTMIRHATPEEIKAGKRL